ncbi:MAG TPA: bifunctional phosphopantothenoylcysteine decarboxylase/phosphopantothenate--cysteine ligase CoaBC [Longimicrobiales bacterium]|nr:bifunctional phosphopantothenoylcysteine decarboxylase/phosphopantothenate--cysteine ligase CoaBC [Longimicrobiales bacterium]
MLTPRTPWKGRRVVLCVGGGVAAYKTAQLARDLTQLGARVEVVLSRSAQEFVTPLTYEALTGRPAHHDPFRVGGAAVHIDIAREADVVCVAPATADLIARHAAGMADDLVASVLLATRAPVLICPAMNPRMWTHPATVRNVSVLRDEFGHGIVGPDEGALGYGERSGVGRMVEPAVILQHVGRALARGGALDGRRVVVTAGPTREPVDAVRVLSNRSSGRMGYAIAAESWRRGALVTLISGPSDVEPPAGPELIRVETAEEMRTAVREAIRGADALVMSAAVADFRPSSPGSKKIKKSEGPRPIELEAAPDILTSTIGDRAPGMVVVGFALETDDARANARRKLDEKKLDLIVLNQPDASAGSGFEVDTNRVTLIGRDDSIEELPLLSKDDVAATLLDRVARLVAGERDRGR